MQIFGASNQHTKFANEEQMFDRIFALNEYSQVNVVGNHHEHDIFEPSMIPNWNNLELFRLPTPIDNTIYVSDITTRYPHEMEGIRELLYVQFKFHFITLKYF